MNTRATNLKSIRPEIPSIDTSKNVSAAENFQNTVVRPIIKMKSDLLLAHFKNYIIIKKVKWNSLSDQKKIDYLASVFRNDTPFKSEIRGFIIGSFTLDEYTQYTVNQRDISKRMIRIVEKRITDSLELLSI